MSDIGSENQNREIPTIPSRPKRKLKGIDGEELTPEVADVSKNQKEVVEKEKEEEDTPPPVPEKETKDDTEKETEKKDEEDEKKEGIPELVGKSGLTIIPSIPARPQKQQLIATTNSSFETPPRPRGRGVNDFPLPSVDLSEVPFGGNGSGKSQQDGVTPLDELPEPSIEARTPERTPSTSTRVPQPAPTPSTLGSLDRLDEVSSILAEPIVPFRPSKKRNAIENESPTFSVGTNDYAMSSDVSIVTTPVGGDPTRNDDLIREEEEEEGEEEKKDETKEIVDEPIVRPMKVDSMNKSLPQIPKRPTKGEVDDVTSSDESPVSLLPANETTKDETQTSIGSVNAGKLNSEHSDGEEGDGDKTPGNSDTKVTFKTFEEEGGPISDSSSFDDDLETVLQEREEKEENKQEDDKVDTPAKDIPSNSVTPPAVPEKDPQSSEGSVVKPPTIPRRPPRPAKVVSEGSISSGASGSDVPTTKSKPPPPKPKKLSSKIAAFQEMFSQQSKPLPSIPRREVKEIDESGSGSSSPSIPKRPSKLSDNRAKFAQSLQGMMGRGIAMPGMVNPAMLAGGEDEEKVEEEDETTVGGVEKNEEPPKDVRKGRAKGPRGKKLPKAIKEAPPVETSPRFDMVIEDLWEVTRQEVEEKQESLDDDISSEEFTFDVPTHVENERDALVASEPLEEEESVVVSPPPSVTEISTIEEENEEEDENDKETVEKEQVVDREGTNDYIKEGKVEQRIPIESITEPLSSEISSGVVSTEAAPSEDISTDPVSTSHVSGEQVSTEHGFTGHVSTEHVTSEHVSTDSNPITPNPISTSIQTE